MTNVLLIANSPCRGSPANTMGSSYGPRPSARTTTFEPIGGVANICLACGGVDIPASNVTALTADSAVLILPSDHFMSLSSYCLPACISRHLVESY